MVPWHLQILSADKFLPCYAGARIASIVVSRPELFQEWNEEMEYMSGRIKVRQPLQPLSTALPSASPDKKHSEAKHVMKEESRKGLKK